MKVDYYFKIEILALLLNPLFELVDRLVEHMVGVIPDSIEVVPKQTSSVVPKGDSLFIDHWDQNNGKHLLQGFDFGIIGKEK